MTKNEAKAIAKKLDLQFVVEWNSEGEMVKAPSWNKAWSGLVDLNGYEDKADAIADFEALMEYLGAVADYMIYDDNAAEFWKGFDAPKHNLAFNN